MAGKNNTNNNRIAFLDYLRIFAFSSVLIGHQFRGWLISLQQDPGSHPTPRLIASALPHFLSGGAGVLVFFLVSGYIITRILESETTTEFLIKRIFRIYPLYMFAVLLAYLTSDSARDVFSWSVLLQQLFLVGDFFNTIPALGGIEWTLRIEVVFYVFMAALRFLNVTVSYQKILPYILSAATLLCFFYAPFPAQNGFLTSYGPFLFLGSMMYLFEKKKVGLAGLLIVGALIFYQHYSRMVIDQPLWLDPDPRYQIDCHFSLAAFFVFFVAWFFRGYITAMPWVIFVSDMTYAVYLFHVFLLNYIRDALGNPKIQFVSPDVQALIILLAICVFFVYGVEKPWIKFGRYILNKIKGA